MDEARRIKILEREAKRLNLKWEKEEHRKTLLSDAIDSYEQYIKCFYEKEITSFEKLKDVVLQIEKKELEQFEPQIKGLNKYFKRIKKTLKK